MVRPPTDDEKELIIAVMDEVPSPLVYAQSLYNELEEYHGMDHDVLQRAMLEMQTNDRIGWMYISPENEDDIPSSEYVYQPDQDQEMSDFLD